ncbi:CHAT domain-containing protein [Flexivirga oryzae]|uniref:CHAT domain-containing protein/tetratricopeptide (TPR) repeat protein n=1 Tax=Flexivirga oryzae TaxID=1794944 RepID=A0A839NB85_9MICO|nr:CHAT domain-containing protein/tetratricopeptide (TPR) repeat protein [Flexivirga oryzae]
MLSADELHRRGLAAINSGRPPLATRLLDLALSRATDPDLQDRIDISRAYVASERGDLHTGTRLCESVLERATNATVRDLAHSQLGVLYTRAGEGELALQHLQQAMAGRRLIGVDRARALMNRGVVWLQRGDMPSAISDFDASSEDFREAGMPVEAAQALHNSGYALMLAGDLPQALQRMDSARPVLAPLSANFRAVCDQDRAEVLVAAGLHHEAHETVASVAAAYGRMHLSQQQGEAEFLLARLLLLDDPARARVLARRAARRWRRRGSDAWADRADGIELAAEAGLRRRSADLSTRADEIAERLAHNGLRNDANTVRLHAARIELMRGDPDSARRRLREVRLRTQAPIAGRLLRRQVEAELDAASGRPGSALRRVRQGLSDLHEWQSSFGSLDLQSSLAGHGRELALLGIRVALEGGRPESVFEWSERARELSRRVLPIRPPASADTARDLVELRQLRAGSGPDEISGRERELRQHIRQRAWQDPGSGVVTEPVGFDQLTTALGDDTVLLAHLAVDDELHLLTVSAQGADVTALGPTAPVREAMAGLQADLDMSASNLPRTLQTAVRSSLLRRLERLDDALLAPVRTALRRSAGGRVVLTPTGVLAGVPWSMLPTLSGHPACLPPSASRWVERGIAPPLRSAAFVAGPRVPRAGEEVVRSSAARPGSTVLTPPESTSAAVSRLAATVDVLHLSAHGRHAADNPLFSGLQLSDGTWFGYDIDQLERIPSLVVLSACELGRSSVRWAEETLGMTTAWLHAGARCVIAAPAAVNDDEACDQLTEAHQLIAGGVPPADALSRTAPSGGSRFQCYGSGW